MHNILESFSLRGKKALIVCPENPYGTEIAQGLAAAGAEIWTAGQQSAVPGIPTAGHIPYVHGDAEDAVRLENAVRERMNGLDVLVENGMCSDLSGWDGHGFADIYDQLCRTHLGLMQTVQSIGYIMAEQGCGSVILVADYGALVGYDPLNYADCPEQKERDFSLLKGFIQGAVVNYARQASNFLGENGCRCNALAIGPMANRQPPAFESAFIRHCQIPRLATAEDVGKAAIFLASDASAYITGITLPVDGGYTAK